MAKNLRTVSIGELVVSAAPDDVLVAYGLGSCVAVCIYDPVAGVGGILHALLPYAPENANGAVENRARFVDQGVPMLLEALSKGGASQSRVIVRLCGGAQMLTAPGFDNAFKIGERNVQAATAALRAAGLRVQSQSTGGNSGRTVKLDIETGQVTVKVLGQEERPLA